MTVSEPGSEERSRTQPAAVQHPWQELRLPNQLREELQLEMPLLALSRQEVEEEMPALRSLADRLSERQDATGPVSAGEINALGLLDELQRQLLCHVLESNRSDLCVDLQQQLDRVHHGQELQTVLTSFADSFTPTEMRLSNRPAPDWLTEQSNGVSHQQTALEELLLLKLDNDNPATTALRELMDDSNLQRDTKYHEVITELERLLEEVPTEREGVNLLAMLRAPAEASPDSLAGQLLYIQQHWHWLDMEWSQLLLRALDYIREEEKPGRHGAPGAATAEVWTPAVGDEDEQRYSYDSDWMPRVVMQAKNTYVWLEQLSREYGSHVARLDQVPDSELEKMSGRGVTALWLIGVWERSPASRRIKQLMGDGEALASAYSLQGYRVADALGGEEALAELRARASRFGIRLAGDMVPNHTGIDSDWVRHHPDRFVQLSEPPYPGYSFSGENLSGDSAVELRLEDGYYRRDDAAVVFQRIDRHSDEVRYLYHGNDGTRMPWNDTAQLDLLQAEVREAVIREILDVARRFPLIRFDAAMTLARKHFQRLWYPAPGSGGDIPSRAERGLSQAEFVQRFPVEFWREVVDRVKEEVPDTLLLAEAFWLMEGYFVRTLGMHRVYNSAFMHMLRDEDNGKYRAALKETLAWDARILERYVNFMSNPDEEAAVTQYGRGDKYLGVAILLATLPGLPMLGHGQPEGLVEKYGMEFLKPRTDEQPDRDLMARQERLLYPILRRRRLFADVREFQLFDLQQADGSVAENVYAYSNRRGDEQALVVYHNSYAETAGWIGQGVEVKPDGVHSRSYNLCKALGLPADALCRFRDHTTGLEYLRWTSELAGQGMYLELTAYGYHVFWDFETVVSSAVAPWSDLERELQGRGVTDLEGELLRLRCRPLQEELRLLIRTETVSAAAVDKTEDAVQRLCTAAESCGFEVEVEVPAGTEIQLPLISKLQPESSRAVGWMLWLQERLVGTGELSAVALLRNCDRLLQLSKQTGEKRPWLAAAGLTGVLAEELRDLFPADEGDLLPELIEAVIGLLELRESVTSSDPVDRLRELLPACLQLPETQKLLAVHEHDSVYWFNRERCLLLLNWLPLFDLSFSRIPKKELASVLSQYEQWVVEVSDIIKQSEFQLNKLTALLQD